MRPILETSSEAAHGARGIPAGKTREILVYWNRTERLLWFDTVAGAVRIKTQCGSTIVFEEKEVGIIFRARQTIIGLLQEGNSNYRYPC